MYRIQWALIIALNISGNLDSVKTQPLKVGRLKELMEEDLRGEAGTKRL